MRDKVNIKYVSLTRTEGGLKITRAQFAERADVSDQTIRDYTRSLAKMLLEDESKKHNLLLLNKTKQKIRYYFVNIV